MQRWNSFLRNLLLHLKIEKDTIEEEKKVVKVVCMAYIKFKELAKYFDFKMEVPENELALYAKEYIDEKEDFVFAYKNHRDYVLFTTSRMILFDRDALGAYYKKIHIIPYRSISSSAINYKPGKVELLFSLDSGYQLHLNFIEMNHDKKENIKAVYKMMMSACL